MSERRGFAGTVSVGLLGGALAAVGASREWASSAGDAAGVAVSGSVTGSDAAPLVLALSLVALAAWGVVLVLRGRSRQVGALVGALAAAGALVALVAARATTQDAAVEAAQAAGATGDTFTSSLSAWYYATAVGAALTLAALVVAVAKARTWPAMGSRYDAPGASAGTAAPRRTAAGGTAASADGAGATAQPDDRELWKALDEGHDPTV